MLLDLSHFVLSFCPPSFVPHLPQLFPHLSSCPWVIHISSLASPFPILFLTSPCLFYSYSLCFLFPVHFPPFSPLPLPGDNLPCDCHFCESVPILVVCLVRFCVRFHDCFCFLVSVVDNFEFAILLFIVFIFFFFLDKSL